MLFYIVGLLNLLWQHKLMNNEFIHVFLNMRFLHWILVYEFAKVSSCPYYSAYNCHFVQNSICCLNQNFCSYFYYIWIPVISQLYQIKLPIIWELYVLLIYFYTYLLYLIFFSFLYLKLKCNYIIFMHLPPSNYFNALLSFSHIHGLHSFKCC